MINKINEGFGVFGICLGIFCGLVFSVWLTRELITIGKSLLGWIF